MTAHPAFPLDALTADDRRALHNEDRAAFTPAPARAHVALTHPTPARPTKRAPRHAHSLPYRITRAAVRALFYVAAALVVYYVGSALMTAVGVFLVIIHP